MQSAIDILTAAVGHKAVKYGNPLAVSVATFNALCECPGVKRLDFENGRREAYVIVERYADHVHGLSVYAPG